MAWDFNNIQWEPFAILGLIFLLLILLGYTLAQDTTIYKLKMENERLERKLNDPMRKAEQWNGHPPKWVKPPYGVSSPY